MTIIYLIEKEFKQMFRNFLLPVLFVLLPLTLMNMLPRLATQEIKNLAFTVVDLDHSTASQRLVQKLSASRYFTLIPALYSHTKSSCSSKALRGERVLMLPSSYREAMTLVESGDADFIVVIDRGFEKRLVCGGGSDTGKIQISANGVNGVKAGLGSGYLTQIIMDFNREISEEKGIQNSPSPFREKVGVRAFYNPTLDYKVYMIPAVLALLVVLFVGFLPALNIVGEKETGTIEQINVTPVGRITFIFSKLVPYWTVGLFLITLSMLAARALYGIAPQGNLAVLYLACTVFILVMSSFGLIVSNHSSTLRQAALLMFFFLVICILMSGLLTPIASMPQWAQWLTVFNPFRYIIAALRILYIRPDSGLSEVSSELIILLIFALIASIWATKSYRKCA